jgi:hypothetical protein
LIVVPSVQIAASTDHQPASSGSASKSTAGLNGRGCANSSARRIGATTCAICGFAGRRCSTNLPTRPVEPT